VGSNSGTSTGLVSAALSSDLGGQVQSLDDGRELDSHHVWAHGGRRTRVLTVEHGLVRTNERGQSITLIILLALLVESPVEVRLEALGLVDVVLKTNRETNGVGLGCEELVEVELVSGSERETGVVFVSINIVGLNTITTLGNSEVQTLNHDVANNGRANINVILTSPTVETISLNGRGERRGIRSPILVLSAEIAYNDSPL